MAIEAPFITRVVIENYKSIAHCDVQLGPITFLVGRNGAGKSNFLDALRFVADSLRTTLDQSIRERGGFERMLCRTSETLAPIRILLNVNLPNGRSGKYMLRLGARVFGSYDVLEEECGIAEAGAGTPLRYFRVRDGQVETSAMVSLPASADRLYLVAASGLPEFRPMYDALTGMYFYNIDPHRTREPQTPTASAALARDGSNIAGIFGRLARQDPAIKQRIEEYLAAIVPTVDRVTVDTLADKEFLTFYWTQKLDNMSALRKFQAESMSDGTLRALGILVALFQTATETSSITLIGVEEPETALHPAATAVLRDALREASASRQVLVTSHSADMLDNKDVPGDWLRAAAVRNGVTTIGPLSDADRSILRDHLFTAGELLRHGDFIPATPPTIGIQAHG